MALYAFVDLQYRYI